MATQDRYFRIAGSLTSQGATTETTLQFPDQGGSTGKSVWLMASFHFVRTGGTASLWTPRAGQAATWTDEDINERLSYASSGNNHNDVFAEPIPCRTDANGRLYFRPEFVGVSTDNTCDYEFWFKKARGS